MFIVLEHAGTNITINRIRAMETITLAACFRSHFLCKRPLVAASYGMMSSVFPSLNDSPHSRQYQFQVFQKDWTAPHLGHSFFTMFFNQLPKRSV